MASVAGVLVIYPYRCLTKSEGSPLSNYKRNNRVYLPERAPYNQAEADVTPFEDVATAAANMTKRNLPIAFGVRSALCRKEMANS
jgi:hypothetical protein